LSNFSIPPFVNFAPYVSHVGPIGVSYNVDQRYINSSPPYDMGDGHCYGFLFLEINAAKEIQRYYIADAPPWAYNGPTNITADCFCPVTKKKFKKVRKKRSFEELMDGSEITYELQEITKDFKNSDMALIPHPFGEISEGNTVVLLDPMQDSV